MQFKAIIVALVAASNAVNAVSIPNGVLVQARAVGDAWLSARATAAKPQNNNTKADCDAAKRLQEGIEKNIQDQDGELSSAKTLLQILAKTPVDQAQFKKEKSVLLGHVYDGITQREANQKIAPKGNAAIAGLAKVIKKKVFGLNGNMKKRNQWLTSIFFKTLLTQQVADAQKTELSQALTLCGNATDTATLNTMVTEFQNGIKQNQQNAKDVSILVALGSFFLLFLFSPGLAELLFCGMHVRLIKKNTTGCRGMLKKLLV